MLEPLGPHELKGVEEPVELYRVTGVVESQARFAARARGGLSELVGRDEERHRLRAACDAAPAGQRTVLLLTGEPGIGKSRLVHASQVYAAGERGMQVVWAECSPNVRRQALHPIVGALAHHCRPDEPGAFDRLAGARTDRRAEVVLADVLGRPHRDAEVAAIARVVAARKGWPHCGRHAGDASPALLLIVGDMHWADPTTSSGSGVLEAPAAPLVLLLTARPD